MALSRGYLRSLTSDTINHLFYILRHRWLEVKATQVALKAATGFGPGPNPEVSQTAFKLPHYKASFVMVRPRALSSRYATSLLLPRPVHQALPSQLSVKLTFL